jgi:hypothetical protein
MSGMLVAVFEKNSSTGPLRHNDLLEMKTKSPPLLLLLAVLIVGLLICGMNSWREGGTSSFEGEVEDLLSEILEEECSSPEGSVTRHFSFWVEADYLADKRFFDVLSLSSDRSSAVRLSHWMVPLRI